MLDYAIGSPLLLPHLRKHAFSVLGHIPDFSDHAPICLAIDLTFGFLPVATYSKFESKRLQKIDVPPCEEDLQHLDREITQSQPWRDLRSFLDMCTQHPPASVSDTQHALVWIVHDFISCVINVCVRFFLASCASDRWVKLRLTNFRELRRRQNSDRYDVRHVMPKSGM